MAFSGQKIKRFNDFKFPQDKGDDHGTHRAMNDVNETMLEFDCELQDR